MKTTEGMTIRMTRKACHNAAVAGFTPEVIQETFEKPAEVYPNRTYPGQYRVTGNGLCLVGAPQGDVFFVITCFRDRVAPDGSKMSDKDIRG